MSVHIWLIDYRKNEVIKNLNGRVLPLWLISTSHQVITQVTSLKRQYVYLNFRNLKMQRVSFILECGFILLIYIWFLQIDLLVEEIKDFKGVSILGFIHIDKPTVTTVKSHFIDLCNCSSFENQGAIDFFLRILLINKFKLLLTK